VVDNKCLVSLFRFDCTVVGQTVTDCFRCLQYHRKQLTKCMTMAEIADLLAWDCVYNWYPKDANDEGGPRSYLLPTAGESREQVFRNEPIASTCMQWSTCLIIMMNQEVKQQVLPHYYLLIVKKIL